MFSKLGLFGSTACPDVDCRRVSCPLSHSGAKPVDARKLLGFQPTIQTRPVGQEVPAGSSATKKRGLDYPVGQQRQVKAKVGPASSSTAGAASSPTSLLTSPRTARRASSSNETSSIASLRSQAKLAAPPSLQSKRDGSSASGGASRPNAVASSSKTPLEPPRKSSFLQRPPSSIASGKLASSASSTTSNGGRTGTSAVVRQVPVAKTTSVTSSHRIPTTARSSGSLAPSSKQPPLTRPASRPAPPKTSRPQPDALRLNLLPSQTVVPLKTRNKGIDVLFKEFIKLYEALEDAEGWEAVGVLAGDDALRQEAECYSKGGKMGYSNAITNTMTAIRKRPPPTSLSHPSVGLQSAYIKSLADLSESAASRLSAPIISSLVHPRAELERYGYLVDVPHVEGGQHPTAEGLLKVCDRCKVEFVVGDESAKCWYHWGRARYGKDQGIRTQMATCCGIPWTSQGCTTSTHHVFKETDSLDLHDRVAYISSTDLPAPSDSTRLDVVGLDCEMLMTTGGLTLARVTVVDEDGKSLLDEFVRPDPARVLDYNTRFSGIKPGEVETAAMDLDHVRAALGTLVGPETAIIGHGLENDLNALRLVHDKIIDTALLYPHPSGPPYRLALRDLMMKHLNKVIQNAGSTGEGHSSLEDAAGSVELVRLKAKDMRERQGKGVDAS